MRYGFWPWSRQRSSKIAQMMARLRVGPDDFEQLDDGAVFSRAVRACDTCDAKGACQQWLDDVVLATDAPSFCKNKAHFDKLRSCEWS